MWYSLSMKDNQNKTSSTITYDMTSKQEKLYDELDAQGVLSPDRIRAELGIGQAVAVLAAGASSRDETNATVVKLERGSRYGPHRHIAPSDRDTEPGSDPPPVSTLPKPKAGEPSLWRSDGHLAAAAALQAATGVRREA